MNSEATIQRRVVYRGRVQGVGFRYTTRSIARRFPVAGWVKNLPDGGVELVVEGADDSVRTFLEAVGKQFRSNITGVEDLPSTLEIDSDRFEIAH